MSTTLTSAGLELSLRWLFENELDLGNALDSNSLPISVSLADGTGADQAEIVWHDRRTLAAAGVDNLDLAGGLVDAFGNTLAFTSLKALVLKNRGTASDDVLDIGGHATAALSSPFGAANDKLKLGPDGLLLLWNPSAAGYSVTAGTADILRIENTGGNSLDYDIVMIGTDS